MHIRAMRGASARKGARNSLSCAEPPVEGVLGGDVTDELPEVVEDMDDEDVVVVGTEGKDKEGVPEAR